MEQSITIGEKREKFVTRYRQAILMTYIGLESLFVRRCTQRYNTKGKRRVETLKI